jgi:DNA polymerase elongation subunit (family B)
MYPSIIQAFNICYTTYADDSVPDDECHIIEWQEGNNVYRYRFRKEPRGILPQLVHQLVDDRNRVRREQKSFPKESLEYIILEKRQLALKISANALYGFLGTHKEYSLLPFIPGARSVTAKGRQLILQCHQYLTEKYHIKPIYGDTDSIMFQVPSVNDYTSANEWGKRLEQDINTNLLKPPLSTEFEKTGRILCIKKKHYAFWLADSKGLRYNTVTTITDRETGQVIRVNTNDPRLNDSRYVSKTETTPDMLFKGILPARNDNTTWHKRVYKTLLYYVMSLHTLTDAFSLLVDLVLSLIRRQVPTSDLVMYREYTANYKDNSNYYFKTFCERNESIVVGDRIGYVVVDRPGKLFERMVLIEHLSDTDVKLDRLYYVERLANSVNTLFNVVYQTELQRLNVMYEQHDIQYFTRLFNACFSQPIEYYLQTFGTLDKVVDFLLANLRGKSLSVLRRILRLRERRCLLRITSTPVNDILSYIQLKSTCMKELKDKVGL